MRSVALAYVMKYEAGGNAVATGIDFLVDRDAVKSLLDFADHVLVVSDSVERQFRELLHKFEISHKSIILVNIGDDVWGMEKGPYCGEIQAAVEVAAAKVGLLV